MEGSQADLICRKALRSCTTPEAYQEAQTYGAYKTPADDAPSRALNYTILA